MVERKKSHKKSECLGEISCRASEGWKRAEGQGCTVSLGEKVGELTGTEGVVGGTDGPGSGIKFDCAVDQAQCPLPIHPLPCTLPTPVKLGPETSLYPVRDSFRCP